LRPVSEDDLGHPSPEHRSWWCRVRVGSEASPCSHGHVGSQRPCRLPTRPCWLPVLAAGSVLACAGPAGRLVPWPRRFGISPGRNIALRPVGVTVCPQGRFSFWPARIRTSGPTGVIGVEGIGTWGSRPAGILVLGRGRPDIRPRRIGLPHPRVVGDPVSASRSGAAPAPGGPGVAAVGGHQRRGGQDDQRLADEKHLGGQRAWSLAPGRRRRHIPGNVSRSAPLDGRCGGHAEHGFGRPHKVRRCFAGTLVGVHPPRLQHSGNGMCSSMSCACSVMP
jgi:hypothetical protein